MLLRMQTLYATSEPQEFTDGSPAGSSYLPDTYSVWIIHPSVPGGQVEVTLTWLDLEDGYDFVSVRPYTPFVFVQNQPCAERIDFQRRLWVFLPGEWALTDALPSSPRRCTPWPI